MKHKIWTGCVLLTVLAAAALLLSACIQTNQNREQTDTVPSVTQVTSVSEETETTAVCASEPAVTTEAAAETEMTMQTFAAVTEADPSPYQHRNYSPDPDDPDNPKEEITLPTVQTVRTARTTARTTAAAVKTTADSAKTTVTTLKTTKKTTAVTTAPALNSLKTEMNRLVRNYKRNCAMLLTAADGTVLYSYQPNTAISGASLIKLPYVYFCCQQLSGGVRSLSDTVTYTKSWYHGGSGIIRKNGYNKTYTVAQLIEYALKYSDNVAYDMLVYLFGIPGFDDMVRSWGYSVSIKSSRFPAVTASFMQTAMNKMQAASGYGKCWQIAWNALTGSQHSYVRDTLGISGMAVKYGSISAQYHETCWIPGEMPCTLVILSGAVNYKPDVSFVQNVARCAQKMISAYEQSLFETTTTTTTTTTATTTETTASAAETGQTAVPDDPTETVFTVTAAPEPESDPKGTVTV